jgi:O-antigen/teichoic acid export membrane protein
MLVKIIKNFKNRYLTGKSFAANVLTLITGTAVAQGLTIVATPILVRLYTPKDFGLLALLTTIAGTVSIVASWRYETAVVLPDKDEDAVNLLILCLLLVLAMTGLSVLVVDLCHQQITSLLGEPELEPWLWTVAPSLLFTGLYQALSYWSTRKQDFQVLALSRVSQFLATIASQISLSFLAATSGAIGLISGQLFGQFIGAAVLAGQIWQIDKTKFKNLASFKTIKNQAIKFKKFPIYTSLPSLLDSLALVMPVLFLTNVFGATITGYFALASRIINLPSSLISSSVAQAILPRLAIDKTKTGRTAPLVEKALNKLILLSCVLFISLQFSPWIFQLFLGANWKTAGIYAKIMAAAVTIRFVVSPLSVVLIAYQKQEILAYWQLAYMVSTAAALGISILYSDPVVSLYFLVGNELILYSIYLILILRVSQANLLNSIRLANK